MRWFDRLYFLKSLSLSFFSNSKDNAVEDFEGTDDNVVDDFEGADDNAADEFYCRAERSASMSASRTRMRACTMPRLRRSALDFPPAYVGL